MTYTISPAAESDLESIGDFIAEDNPARAVTFIQEIRETFSQLAKFPRSAPRRSQLGPDVRMRPVGDYNIYYRPVENGIEILRVLHAARGVDSDAFSP